MQPVPLFFLKLAQQISLGGMGQLGLRLEVVCLSICQLSAAAATPMPLPSMGTVFMWQVPLPQREELPRQTLPYGMGRLGLVWTAESLTFLMTDSSPSLPLDML